MSPRTIHRGAEIAEQQTEVYRIRYIVALPCFPRIFALLSESAALLSVFSVVLIGADSGLCSAFLLSRELSWRPNSIPTMFLYLELHCSRVLPT
jgi:hypothetical protein